MSERVRLDTPFAGIDAPNTTPVPDVYFDVLFPRLGKGSLKVLLYIVRRTFGFKKDGDTISLSQICNGIRRRDGTTLDRGTGLKRETAAAAVRELDEMGVIVVRRSLSPKGDAATNYYTPRFREQLSINNLLSGGSPEDAGYRFPGIDSPNTTPVPDIYFDLLLPALGLAEWRVLLYVVRRTLGFKKLSDAISLDQFVDGITTADGRRLDHGTGLSRSSVSDAISTLVMRNVLVRQRVFDAHSGDGVSVFSLAMRDETRASLGQTLGLADGPLRAIGEARRGAMTGIGQADYRRVAQSDHPGVAQPDHEGIDESDYPHAPLEASHSSGVAQSDHPGVEETDHPRPAVGTTEGGVNRPPVGGQADPQQTVLQDTESQQTVLQDNGEMGARPYADLLQHIASDLGVPGAATAYSGKVHALAERTTLAAPDFYSALIEGWKATRAKLQQQALQTPTAAMAYFYTVLCRRVEHDNPLAETGEPDRGPMQDTRFVEAVARRLGHPPDQGAWLAILHELSLSMTPPNFTRWFRRTALVEGSDALQVVVPDALHRDWLATHLQHAIQREAARLGEERPLRFVALDDLSR